MTWKATGSTNLDLADHKREWDGDEAKDRIFAWAGGDDDFDQSKVQRAFFAYDGGSPENVTSYKLPFADVIDGELRAVPRGIYAVAQVLEGARGGVDLPDSVIGEVRSKVKAYYDKMDEKVPW